MAHAFDAKLRIPVTANTTTTANPATASFTCGAGCTVLVMGIIVGGTTARTGGAPTYNGVALTQAGITLTYGETNVECWYLLDPPTGSALTVSIPNAGGLSLDICVVSFKAQSGYKSLLDVATGGTGFSTSPSYSVTTTANGDAIFAVCGSGANNWAPTARSGVQVYDNDNTGWGGGSQYALQATAGAIPMSWTFTVITDDWAIAIASFKEVAVPTTSLQVVWSILEEKSVTASWDVKSESSCQSSWKIYSEQSKLTGWGILDEIENGSAWSVLAESAITSAWGVLVEDEQGVSWAIADEIDSSASWFILTESQISAGWSILKEISTSTAWDILQDGQMSVSLSWGILAEDGAACGWSVLSEQSASSGWSTLTEDDCSTGWEILTESATSSSWKILTEESAPISWAVDAINEVSAGIGWSILDETSVQTGWSTVSGQSSSVSWSILTEQSSDAGWDVLVEARASAEWSIIRESTASIGWRISVAEAQAGISWSIIRQRHLSTEWRVLAERPVTLAWRDMAEIMGGVSWRVAGTNPAPETLGIDFASLLPPSIAYDPGIMAAAGGSSAAFTDTRNLIPEAVLYARIDELSSEALDHIAWGFHIDGWEFAETIERKRAFVKLFFDFHRYKGTAYGLRLYWRALINRLVLKIDPPGKSFLGVSMTQEERERFEGVHPEVRVYPFRHSGAKRSFFCGDCTGDPAEDYGVYPARTEALLRIGDRVTVYDPQLDEETEINRFEYDTEYVAQKATDTIEIRKPGNESFGGIFLGRYLEGETVNTGADQRLYSLTLDREYTTELERRTPLSIQPSLTPFRTTYETETENGVAVGIHLGNRYPDDYPETGGSCIGQHFPVASNASERIYRKLRLFDPDRVPGTMSTGRMTYLGAFRVGQQLPHTARVAVDMQGKRIPGAQFVSGYLRGRHLCTSDAETRIEQMRYVGKMAKRASDKVLISIRNRYEITTSSGLLTGTKKCGQIELEVI